MDRYHAPGLRSLLILCWVLALRGSNGDITEAPTIDFPDCEDDAGLLGDAICDLSLNVVACGYDGGDCCECSCEDTDEHECGKDGAGFFCLDPDAPTDCRTTASPTPGPTTSPSPFIDSECQGYAPHVQDGYCDPSLNNAACGWDGGDCCVCTCLEGLDHECGEDGLGFDCRDPDAPGACGSSSSANSSECKGDVSGFEDGACDDDLNNADCEWDGGDCCECTCREFGGSVNCGSNGYDCLDPLAPTECDSWASFPPQQTPSTSEFSECTGLPEYIADGYCDESNNNAQCAWDGGDCCACTCVVATFFCDGSSFDCLDPHGANCSATTSSSGGHVTEAEEEESGGMSSSGGGCLQTTAVGDGYCDFGYNTLECDWDGGDCCECTCVDGLGRACGDNGYVCRDPDGDGSCAPTPSPDLASIGPSYADGSSPSLSSMDVIFMFLGSVAAFACFIGAFAALLSVVDRMVRARVVPTPGEVVTTSGGLKRDGVWLPSTSTLTSPLGSVHQDAGVKQGNEGGESKCCSKGEGTGWGTDDCEDSEERSGRSKLSESEGIVFMSNRSRLRILRAARIGPSEDSGTAATIL